MFIQSYPLQCLAVQKLLSKFYRTFKLQNILTRPLTREVEKLTHHRHPNIISLYGFFIQQNVFTQCLNGPFGRLVCFNEEAIIQMKEIIINYYKLLQNKKLNDKMASNQYQANNNGITIYAFNECHTQRFKT
ncbi:unnamed protein product [Paramecium sonneborni]|uniref:Protein kinase domain-containing protein n=1 Tax=Paramecium sonneborni TaxID=65129 RepID=A0A8S1RNX2_9CILI|nr:unnamed protein product [Paramecium sonneborni]